MRPAVFLDRDGTLIELVHYLADPADVRLVDGAADAVVSLRAAGFACVLVTNQSMIGRGMATERELARVHRELLRQLEAAGAALDGAYYCPVRPGDSGRRSIEHMDRKPGPGMLMRAARDHTLDLAGSWMVGDTVADVLAGRHAGCRGVLVRTGYGTAEADDLGELGAVADDVTAAAELILAATIEQTRSRTEAM